MNNKNQKIHLCSIRQFEIIQLKPAYLVMPNPTVLLDSIKRIPEIHSPFGSNSPTIVDYLRGYHLPSSPADSWYRRQ